MKKEQRLLELEARLNQVDSLFDNALIGLECELKDVRLASTILKEIVEITAAIIKIETGDEDTTIKIINADQFGAIVLNKVDKEGLINASYKPTSN